MQARINVEDIMYLLQETSVLLNLLLLDDVLVKESLRKNLQGTVLLLNTELGSLLVHLDAADLAVVLLLNVDDPGSQLIIGVVGLLLAVNNASALEILG